MLSSQLNKFEICRIVSNVLREFAEWNALSLKNRNICSTKNECDNLTNQVLSQKVMNITFIKANTTEAQKFTDDFKLEK